MVNMPYNSAYSTQSVTVLAVSVSLSVTPSPPWIAGQTITLKATAKSDGAALAGKTVQFRILNVRIEQLEGLIIGTATTDSSGVATLSYTIPWSISGYAIPCISNAFYAVETSTNTYSNYVDGKVAYSTRISISAPATVAPGQSFTVSGKLEYQTYSTTWSGLAVRTVSIYYDGTKAADVTTASDGTYSKAISISTPKTYTLKAQFAGEGLAAAVSILGIEVKYTEIVTPLATILVGGILAYKLSK